MSIQKICVTVISKMKRYHTDKNKTKTVIYIISHQKSLRGKINLGSNEAYFNRNDGIIIKTYLDET